MSYGELKKAAIQALGLTRQGFEYRAKQWKNRYGPMTTEQAIALVAYDAEVDVSRYLDAADLEAIRRLIDHRTIVQSGDAPVSKAVPPTTKTVKLTIGGDLRLSDPLLPLRILEDAREMTRVYARLYVFENSAREVITRVLSAAHGAGWWDTCVPSKVRDKVAKRIDDEKKNPWHGRRNQHPIYYTDMSELGLIVVKNWTTFEDLFPSQSWISQRIDEIARSRNVVDHHNALGKNDRVRLSVYFKDWIDQIEAVKDRLV